MNSLNIESKTLSEYWRQYKIWHIFGNENKYLKFIENVENEIKNVVIEESELKKILNYYYKNKNFITYEKDDFILFLKNSKITTYDQLFKELDHIIQFQKKVKLGEFEYFK